MKEELKSLAVVAIRAAVLASKAIMDVYDSDFTVEFKEDFSVKTIERLLKENTVK